MPHMRSQRFSDSLYVVLKYAWLLSYKALLVNCSMFKESARHCTVPRVRNQHAWERQTLSPEGAVWEYAVDVTNLVFHEIDPRPPDCVNGGEVHERYTEAECSAVASPLTLTSDSDDDMLKQQYKEYGPVYEITDINIGEWPPGRRITE